MVSERIKGSSKVKREFAVEWNDESITTGRDGSKSAGGEDVRQKSENRGDTAEQDCECSNSAGKRTLNEENASDNQSKLSKSQRKRQKRANYLAKRGHSLRQDWENLCSEVAKGKPCSRQAAGETCKFSHSIEEYLKHKPALLSELQCQRFINSKHCSFGVRCLSGGSHLIEDPKTKLISNVDGRSACIVDADKTIAEGSNSKTDMIKFDEAGECNHLSPSVQSDLRKRKYFVESNGSELREALPKPVFKGKIYIAPLTTVGNLPFRRIHKDFGADITCGEMALAKSLVNGERSEWSLVRRHKSEDVFGVQLAGGDPEIMAKAAQLLENEVKIDFVDINVGCPIDMVCNQGAGSALLNRPGRLEAIVDSMTSRTRGRVPIGIKVRTGWAKNPPTTHTLACLVQCWKHTLPFGRAISYLSIHGRSRTARYTSVSDYDFIHRCSERVIAAESIYRRLHPDSSPVSCVPVFGNGDVLSYTDWYAHMDKVSDWIERISEIDHERQTTESRLFKSFSLPGFQGLNDRPLNSPVDWHESLDEIKASLSTLMIGRGALIKPWIATEIKERRHWDISGSERLDIVRKFCNYGLEHWGSDSVGVQKTRRFLLEWLSFMCRYIPVGILDSMYIPQHINDRPPAFRGRDDRESLLSSTNCKDWIKTTELFLGKVSPEFHFEPKHKSNSYSTPQVIA